MMEGTGWRGGTLTGIGPIKVLTVERSAMSLRVLSRIGAVTANAQRGVSCRKEDNMWRFNALPVTRL